jgi:hypothetical protein
MIAKMLEDMGLRDVAAEGWSIDRFATDYLSDDRESDNWEDIWIDTCEIRIRTPQHVQYEPEAPGFVETFAWDDTWTGEPTVPDRCSVIADFENGHQLELAVGVLGDLLCIEQREHTFDEVHRRVPQLSRQLFDDLAREKGETGGISVVVCHRPGQVHVSMPASQEFFEQGAGLALAVRAVCEALGGTTHWREGVV